MKASKAISRLVQLVAAHGDRDIPQLRDVQYAVDGDKTFFKIGMNDLVPELMKARLDMELSAFAELKSVLLTTNGVNGSYVEASVCFDKSIISRRENWSSDLSSLKTRLMGKFGGRIFFDYEDSKTRYTLLITIK